MLLAVVKSVKRKMSICLNSYYYLERIFYQKKSITCCFQNAKTTFNYFSLIKI